MSETHGFIKILPDSTGKRIPQNVMIELSYDTGTVLFSVGDVVTSTSNVKGTIYEVEGNTTTGNLHIKLEEPVSTNPSYIIGENLLVNGSPKAKASSTGYPFYFQLTNITGYKNPLNGWDIQKDGAGVVTFHEGEPIFDAFGKLLVAEQTTMAEYNNSYKMDIERMVNITAGTASIIHDPLSAGLVLSTGTASGDRVVRISNQYHPYQLGKSRLVEFTWACGDVGKANVKRIWGYGDSNDGVFFALVGTTFNVLLRSSVTGTVVETYYPQSSWEYDRVDGSNSVFNSSGVLLDLSKDNIYWVDLQWLGAGKIRFGIVIDGKRIVCQDIDNANKNNRSYMRTGTLPVYFEQVNTGAVASTSESRLWCCVVKQGGAFQPTKRFYGIPELGQISKTITTTTEVPLLSIRPKQTINGIVNRTISFIESLAAISVGGAVQIKIYDRPISLTGATWAVPTDNSIECDVATTAVSGGDVMHSFYVSSGTEKSVDLSSIFNYKGNALFNDANNTAHVWTVTGRLISAGSSNIELTAILSDIII